MNPATLEVRLCIKLLSSQVQLIQGQKLLHNRLVALLQIRIRSEEEHSASIQEHHAVCKFLCKTHVMRDDDAGQMKLELEALHQVA